MAKITDLDELLSPDKKVKLAGKTYTLPGDLPVELYLRITNFNDAETSEREAIEAMYDEVLGLFRYKEPNLKALPLTMPQLVLAIARIYGDDTAEEDAPAPPPRRRASGTGTSSKSRPKSRARRST